ncbi:glycoside hydrolase family 3 N-terminal domain-containing protein [Corynebacterium felinum]
MQTTPTQEGAQREQLRRDIGQLMMVGVRNFDDALYALEQGAGGIFIGSDTDPALLEQPGRDLRALREKVGRAFAVSIDFEGGRVLRHPQVLGSFTSPRQMAATMSPQQVREVALQMGQSLAEHGITVNFAPVVDLDGAGLDVVGDRAFSSDPQMAADYAAAFAAGMLDAGVTPVFKHFPGHGRASGDSHVGGVVTPPLEELFNHDLRPFAQVSGVEGAAMMLGHMQVPGLRDYQGQESPASLNDAAYRLLREGDYPGAVPFGGVIFTDDLSGMRAISDIASIPDAVMLALVAGADQALWISTQQLPEAIDAMVHAVDSGLIDAETVSAKARRVQLIQR